MSNKSALTEDMKKACCNTCLLAANMKDCQNCPFSKYAPKVEQTKEIQK